MTFYLYIITHFNKMSFHIRQDRINYYNHNIGYEAPKHKGI